MSNQATIPYDETRDFDEWIALFTPSICDYGYYVDFDKVYRNVAQYRTELNIMNTLIGARDIETEFRVLAGKYPEILQCVPTLLAVREREIFARDAQETFTYDFKRYGNSLDDYVRFMHKTGLFDLISNHLISNLVDYATGVEVGLDSNGRKNRGGHLMENVVEGFIRDLGVEYYKEMYLGDIEKQWGIDLSPISGEGTARKRFDFVVKTDTSIYAIEANFYKGAGGAGGGSKLNETARSYKLIAQEAKDIEGFKFVWITDGTAWKTARGNLREAFNEKMHIYCLAELKQGVLKDVLA